MSVELYGAKPLEGVDLLKFKATVTIHSTDLKILNQELQTICTRLRSLILSLDPMQGGITEVSVKMGGD